MRISARISICARMILPAIASGIFRLYLKQTMRTCVTWDVYSGRRRVATNDRSWHWILTTLRSRSAKSTTAPSSFSPHFSELTSLFCVITILASDVKSAFPEIRTDCFRGCRFFGENIVPYISVIKTINWFDWRLNPWPSRGWCIRAWIWYPQGPIHYFWLQFRTDLKIRYISGLTIKRILLSKFIHFKKIISSDSRTQVMWYWRYAVALHITCYNRSELCSKR